MLAAFAWISHYWSSNKRNARDVPDFSIISATTATQPPPSSTPAGPILETCFNRFDEQLAAAIAKAKTVEELVAAEAALRFLWTEEVRFDCLDYIFQTVFPLSESFVAKANQATPAALLMVLQSIVYDVTAFVENHPGGRDILEEHAGRESWNTFVSLHSEETIANLLPTMKVGLLVPTVEQLIGAKKASAAAAAPVAAKSAAAARAPPKAYRVQSIEFLTSKSETVANPTASICFEGAVEVPPGGHMRVHCPAERNLKTSRASVRSYTPYETTATTFTISVKHYAGGVVSGYLHSLKVGEEVLMSGPDAPHVPLRPHQVSGDLLLIAGGTGIAPIYSIAKYVLEHTTHSVAIFACFRNADDTLLVHQLDQLLEKYAAVGAEKARCEVHIVFSRLEADEIRQFLHTRHTASCAPQHTGGRHHPRHIRGHAGRLAASHVEISTVATDATTAYVCGPPSFAQSVEQVLRLEGSPTSINLYGMPHSEDGKVVTRVYAL